jgi:hypothetical protein
MSSRGRFATSADSPLQCCSPYRGLHVRRECLGFVHRSRTISCHPRANQTPRFDRNIFHRCTFITARGGRRAMAKCISPSRRSGSGGTGLACSARRRVRASCGTTLVWTGADGSLKMKKNSSLGVRDPCLPPPPPLPRYSSTSGLLWIFIKALALWRTTARPPATGQCAGDPFPSAHLTRVHMVPRVETRPRRS